MKLFLIRHGQSEANLHNIYAGQGDTPLTQLGKEQAATLQPVLSTYQFNKVYASDLQRASVTCETALPGVEYEKLALIREYDVGSLVGEPLGALKRVPDPDSLTYPDYTEFGGENVLMVCDRAKAFLEMLEKEPYAYVAAFSHYGFINCVLRTVLGVTYKTNRIYTENCAVHVVEYDGKDWRILALNYGVQV